MVSGRHGSEAIAEIKRAGVEEEGPRAARCHGSGRRLIFNFYIDNDFIEAYPAFAGCGEATLGSWQ